MENEQLRMTRKIDVSNKPEEKFLTEIQRELIKRKIKRVSVFGTFDEQNVESTQKWKELGNEIADLGLTAIVGGGHGSVNDVSLGSVENQGKVIVVKTTLERDTGYITKNIPGHLKGVYYEDEHAGKFRGLFNRSGAYVILPGGRKGTGTETEMRFALDKINSFDTHVGKMPIPVIFLGDFWRKTYDEQIKDNYDERVWNHVYFINEVTEIEPILLKYAEQKE